jgi:hypothetical protein
VQRAFSHDVLGSEGTDGVLGQPLFRQHLANAVARVRQPARQRVLEPRDRAQRVEVGDVAGPTDALGRRLVGITRAGYGAHGSASRG